VRPGTNSVEGRMTGSTYGLNARSVLILVER
jgi:hypothetical protein